MSIKAEATIEDLYRLPENSKSGVECRCSQRRSDPSVSC